MKVGTKSLLFGVHQVLWHPITVFLAWKKLYGMPSFKEIICIIIHDWGYFGSPNMDGVEGERHPEHAAKIAGNLFGSAYHDLCLLHSRHYARNVGKDPSKLCWADKLSMLYEPAWFYLFRSKLSGELHEYRMMAANAGFVDINLSDKEWFLSVRSKLIKLGNDQTNSVPYQNSIKMY